MSSIPEISKSAPLSESEEIDRMQKSSTLAATDAAQLTHHLRRAGKLLGGSHHQQADNIMGVLVAVSASRLLSTTWPVLLQSLREAADPKVKVAILHHFACISDRITVEQRVNAFRVFANETIALLADVDTIISTTFLRSYTLILESLGFYAEPRWCQKLLTVVVRGLRVWDRTDALRAAATVAVMLVALTSGCGTLQNLLEKSKANLTAFPYALILDNSVPFVLRRGRGAVHGAESDASLAFVRGATSAEMTTIFLGNDSAAEAAPKANVLPPIISAFLKLKDASRGTWCVESESDICRRALTMLKDPGTKRIFITPLLRFLQQTSVRWWKKRGPVWHLASTGDSLTQLEAFAALANTGKHISAEEAEGIAEEALRLLHTFFADGSISLVTGILTLLLSIFPALDGNLAFQERARLATLTLMVDSSSKVSRHPGVRVASLRVISHQQSAPLPCLAVLYTWECLESDSAALRAEARATLLKWCRRFPICECDFLSSGWQSADFYEGSLSYANTELVAFPSEKSGASFVHNVKSVLDAFSRRVLSQALHGCESDKVAHVSFRLRNVREFIEEALAYSGCSEQRLLFSSPLVSLYDFLSDSICAGQYASADVFLEVLPLLATVLRVSGGGRDLHNFSIFDHKELVNFVFNILALCCECVDPSAVIALRCEEWMYFSSVELPGNVVKMVRAAAGASLTNKQPLRETDFYRFLDESVALLVQLIGSATESPIFIGHLLNAYDSLLSCADILAVSNPQTVLDLVHVVHKVFSQDLSPARAEARPSLLSDFVKLLSTTNHVLSRVLRFDLTMVGQQVFTIAAMTVERDTELSKKVCYPSLDPSEVLLEKAVKLIGWMNGYRNGATAHEHALVFLNALVRSPHRQAAQQGCTTSSVAEARAAITEAKEFLGEEALRSCDALLDELEEALTTDGPVYSPVRQVTSALRAKLQALEGTNSCALWFLFVDGYCATFAHCTADEMATAWSAEVLSEFDRLAVLVCTAAVDPCAIPQAVEAALLCEISPYTPVILDFLTSMVTSDWVAAVELRPLSVSGSVPLTGRARRLVSAYQYRSASTLRAEVLNWTARTSGHNDELGKPQPRHYHEAKEEEQLAKSASLSSSSYVNHVPLALKQISTGICALAMIPAELVTENALDSTTIAEMFECGTAHSALRLLSILIDEHNVHLLDERCVVSLARCLLTQQDQSEGTSVRAEGSATSQLDDEGAIALAQSFDRMLPQEDALAPNRGGIKYLALRYSVLFILWTCCPVNLSDFAGSLSPTSAGMELAGVTLRVLSKCCRAPMGTASVSAAALAAWIRERILLPRLCEVAPALEESILWLAARFCGALLWPSVVDSSSTHVHGPRDDTVEDLRFMCMALNTIGIPGTLWGALHAQYTPILLQFGRSQESTSDEQRAALWLVTSLMLYTPWAGDALTKPAAHSSLSEVSWLYDDFPLQSLEALPAQLIRQLGAVGPLPFYKRRRRDPRAPLHTNLHFWGKHLPLGGRPQPVAQDTTMAASSSAPVGGPTSSPDAQAAQKIGVSLIHMLCHTVEEVMASAQRLPPFCLSDVFSTVAALSLRNTNLVRFAPVSSSETIAARIVRVAQRWLQSYGAEWLGDPEIEARGRSALCDHVGLLPSSTALLAFHDTVSIAAVAVILSSLPASVEGPAVSGTSTFSAAVLAGSGEAGGRSAAAAASVGASAAAVSTTTVSALEPPDVVAVVDRMLVTDLFLYPQAMSSVIALSAASRRREVSALSSVVAGYMGEDLNMGRWGLLSIPFVLTQALRASCAVLTMMPDEKVRAKVCEGVWGSLLQRPWGRLQVSYGHYMMQCLLHITPVGGRQWEMMRMLVMSARPPRSAEPAAAVLPLWSIGFRLASQEQKNLLLPHLSFQRRVPLSWSEPARLGCVCDEHAPTVHAIANGYSDVQELVTRATLIFRGACDRADPAMRAQERERARAQVADLAAGAGSASCAEVLCLEVLTENTMPARDTFFAALNRFDFSTPARRALLHELTLVTLAPPPPGETQVNREELLGLLSIVFEATTCRTTCEENSWWIVTVLLCALLSVMNPDVSGALLAAVVVPQSARRLRLLATALATFFCTIPLHSTAQQLLTSLHASAKKGGERSWVDITSALAPLLLILDTPD